jgi:hypothetical protein
MKNLYEQMYYEQSERMTKFAGLIGTIKGNLFDIYTDLKYKTKMVSEEEYRALIMEKAKDLHDSIDQMIKDIYKD